MLGGTIHDVAQVVGAGYAVSVRGRQHGGDRQAVPRVPAAAGGAGRRLVFHQAWALKHGEARVPVPVFAIVFLVLCALNSVMPLLPALLPVYAPVKSALVEASTWGLLLAIGALGLGTSIKTIVGLGWRHITTVLGTTAVIFVIVTGGLLLMRLA